MASSVLAFDQLNPLPPDSSLAPDSDSQIPPDPLTLAPSKSDAFLKPAWRKLDPVESPVVAIEASSWPTLAEARQAKPHISTSDSSASSPQTITNRSAKPKLSALSGVQGSSFHPNRQSNSAHVERNTTLDTKVKPPYKRGGSKNNFLSGDKTFSSPPGQHSTPILLPDPFSGTAGFPAPYPAVGAGPFFYPPFPLNVHSNLQVRGNGWPSHQWRGFGYGANNNVYLQHEQYFKTGNSYAAFAAPMNMNLIHFNQQRNMYNSMPIALPYGPLSRSPGGMFRSIESMTIQSLLQKQIEYYFSTENLCKDMYLRSRMDSEGFVPVSLIASFKRVQSLTTNPMLILEAVRKSSVVEVKGNKIRKSQDWKRWLLPACTSSNGSNPNDANYYKDKATVLSSLKNALVDKSKEHDIHPTRVSTEICPIEILDYQGKEILLDTFKSCSRSLQSTDAEENPVQTDNNPIDVNIQYGDYLPQDTTCGSINKSPLISLSAVVDSNIIINDMECKGSQASQESPAVDDGCPSLGSNIKLYKGHNENRVEEDKRRLITVTHAQLSSCIAVP